MPIAFENHHALFQIGSTPRSRMSVICSGTTTSWCTYGPMFPL